MQTFKTKQDAINYLKSQKDLTEFKPGHFTPSGTYVLSHGEYSAPEYKPVYYPSLKAWRIYRKVFYYAGTFNAPQDGPIDFDF